METVALRSHDGKWVMASSILASSMAFIDSTALNVVLPSLQRSLSATATDLFWILNAYLLILASLILIGGAMGDKLGRKKIFIYGIAVFIAGSLLCGFAPNVNILIAFRAFQGIGGALMIPGSLSLISSSINENERGKAIGTWSAFTTVVTIGGPILGGALADAGLWRFIFFINVPIGLTALFLLWSKVRERRDEKSDKKLDFPGAIFITSALVFITFGFLRAPTTGFNHWDVYGSLIVGSILLLIFIITEYKSKHPMMPLQLFSNVNFSGTNLMTFFLYAGLGACSLFLSLNLVQIQGYTQLQSGLTFLPFTILMISLARLAGGLADRYGPRFFLMVGPALAGTGFLILSTVKQTQGPSEYWTTFFPGIFVFGLGMSLTVAPLTSAVMGSVDVSYSGTASGINNAMTRLASVFANAIFGALAVLFFSKVLSNDIKTLPLTVLEKHSIVAEAVNLGNAKVPAYIDKNRKLTIEKYYHGSFIFAFSRIMRLSAGLGFLGALMSFIFIRNKTLKKVKKIKNTN